MDDEGNAKAPESREGAAAVLADQGSLLRVPPRMKGGLVGGPAGSFIVAEVADDAPAVVSLGSALFGDTAAAAQPTDWVPPKAATAATTTALSTAVAPAEAAPFSQPAAESADEATAAIDRMPSMVRLSLSEKKKNETFLLTPITDRTRICSRACPIRWPSSSGSGRAPWT